ncbi:hypothetical protein LY78DRAFT_341117 [Colletotrichum sublineola]|nr:hypothetical protein LY78DRAFT_341117 [Colletotrichum sublineola]
MQCFEQPLTEDSVLLSIFHSLLAVAGETTAICCGFVLCFIQWSLFISLSVGCSYLLQLVEKNRG